MEQAVPSGRSAASVGRLESGHSYKQRLLNRIAAAQSRADGVYRWWLIRGVPQQDTEGNIHKWFGTCTDIHELKLAELEISRANQALRDSDEKFRELSDNITDVFWITSADFKTMHYVSPGYELIWGRSTESLYADPHQWIEAILPEERESAFAFFATLMGTASEVTVEYRIARPDGTVRWIHDRGFQVRDAAGKLVRITGIATDITERKKWRHKDRGAGLRSFVTIVSEG